MRLILLILVNGLLATASVSYAENERSVSRDKVQFFHRIDAEKIQSLKDSGVSHDSRTYYQEVSGKQLNEGFEISTDGENALLKLSATRQAATQVGARAVVSQVPLDLELYKGEEKRSVEDPSIQMKQTSKALRKIAPKLFKHSEIMTIPAEMGRGHFKLKSKTPVKDDDRFVMYVLDQNSDIELNIESPRSAYSQNENLIFNAEIKSPKKLKTVSMNTVLVAPDGRRFPIKTTRKSNRVKGNWKLDIDAQRNAGELWQLEVESTVLNDQQIPTKRIAKVALDIHPATANLSSIERKKSGLNLLLDIKERGRFEVRTLVAGTDSNGKLKPSTLTYHAEWLEKGLQSIEISIDKKSLAGSDLHAPFVVQSIQLLDQSRMAALQVREGRWIID